MPNNVDEGAQFKIQVLRIPGRDEVSASLTMWFVVEHHQIKKKKKSKEPKGSIETQGVQTDTG